MIVNSYSRRKNCITCSDNCKRTTQSLSRIENKKLVEIQSMNLNLIYHSTFYHQLWEAFKRTVYPEAHFTGLRPVCQPFCLRIFYYLLSSVYSLKFPRSGNLVEMTGIEPATSWLQTRCSPNWATSPLNVWGWGLRIRREEKPLPFLLNPYSLPLFFWHRQKNGGPFWAWTRDLTLIKRAL